MNDKEISLEILAMVLEKSPSSFVDSEDSSCCDSICKAYEQIYKCVNNVAYTINQD